MALWYLCRELHLFPHKCHYPNLSPVLDSPNRCWIPWPLPTKAVRVLWLEREEAVHADIPCKSLFLSRTARPWGPLGQKSNDPMHVSFLLHPTVATRLWAICFRWGLNHEGAASMHGYTYVRISHDHKLCQPDQSPLIDICWQEKLINCSREE